MRSRATASSVPDGAPATWQRVCDPARVGGGLQPTEVGFAPTCPAIASPGGEQCGGDVGDATAMARLDPGGHGDGESNRHRNVDGERDQHDDDHRNPDRDCHRDRDADGHPHSDSHGYGEPDCDCLRVRDIDRNGDPDTHAYRDAAMRRRRDRTAEICEPGVGGGALGICMLCAACL